MAKDQGSEPAIIEVVIERSETAPDGGVQVFIDGKRVDADRLNVVIVDPGSPLGPDAIHSVAGYTRAEWERNYRVTIEAPGLSLACREAVTAAFQRNQNSEFIE